MAPSAGAVVQASLLTPQDHMKILVPHVNYPAWNVLAVPLTAQSAHLREFYQLSPTHVTVYLGSIPKDLTVSIVVLSWERVHNAMMIQHAWPVGKTTFSKWMEVKEYVHPVIVNASHAMFGLTYVLPVTSWPIEFSIQLLEGVNV